MRRNVELEAETGRNHQKIQNETLEDDVCACCFVGITYRPWSVRLLPTLSTMSEKRAIATLAGAVLLSTLTIWAVHFQQHQEREVTSNATVSLI